MNNIVSGILSRLKSFAGNIVILAAVLFLVLASTGINDNGYRTVVQYPWGTTYAKFTPDVGRS